MTIIRLILIGIILLYQQYIYSSVINQEKQTYSIKGKVLSETENTPLSFATVRIESLNISTVCDIDGNFILNQIPTGLQEIQISYIGFNSFEKKIDVGKNINLIVKLATTSFSLPEFEVMAKRKSRDKLVVNEAAIEYVQPTSLSDVLLLLPGNIYKENSMSSFGLISSRQAGSDTNTSLGVAIMADGSPISNDGMRTQLVGITENSSAYSGDTEIKKRTGINSGIDMRYISTDHIQSVEFTRGITSARYGNLSSGMIQIKSKSGVSPLRIRFKADLKNKLVYAGKGFKLPRRSGTLHIGVDYLNSVDDIREEMDKFSRLTGQAVYSNQLKWGDNMMDIEAKISQTISANKMKKDELTYEYNESYMSNYSKTGLLLKNNLSLSNKWIEKIEFMLSSDFVSDVIKRHKMVISSSGPLNVPLAKEEGEHEGIYLPGKYYSDFFIDNKPINVFAQLHGISRTQLTNKLGLNLQYGIDYKRTKNKGEGAVIEDETKPPFPYDNTYMRPRPNWQIPAISIGAAYLQAEMQYKFNDDDLIKLSAGGRATQMFNLDKEYALSGKVLSEPRINAMYIWGNDFKNCIRLGYGIENKLPTMDYLYPEKLYKDFYMLNAYTNEPEYRRLITYTKIFDVANKNIKQNKNKKTEIGWDFEYKGFDISLTAFYENTNSGFEYFKVYNPLTYELYNTLKPGVNISGRVPQKEDYIKEEYSIFTTSTKVLNSKKVIKRGIEYRIITPKIDAIKTTIELNGAYYKTIYASSLPEYYYPGKKIANKPYPYVGIYNTNPYYEYKRLNTNIWMNTHIPKFKLFFTNFVQIVWISSKQYKDSMNKYPEYYIDFNGTKNIVDQNIMNKIDSDDLIFRHLKKTILPIEYAIDSKPISLLWNFKATKELNRFAKLSFFVNGILDINPRYMSGGKTTEREWNNPYFGLELFLNFNL